MLLLPRFQAGQKHARTNVSGMTINKGRGVAGKQLGFLSVCGPTENSQAPVKLSLSFPKRSSSLRCLPCFLSPLPCSQIKDAHCNRHLRDGFLVSPKLHRERRTHTVYRRETREAVGHCAALPFTCLASGFLLGRGRGQGVDVRRRRPHFSLR